GLFHERLRLEPMTGEAARAAITGPAERKVDGQARPYTVPPFGYAPETLDEMVKFLEGSSGVIEPFQLQLLCRHAEKLAQRLGVPAEGPRVLGPENFQGRDDFKAVLQGFYDHCMARLPRGQRGPARRLCEEGLLDAEGHRLMLDVGQITGKFGVEEPTLAALDEDRLLRRERRLESVFYEISHDRLAMTIRDARRFRLPRRWRLALLAGLGTVVALGVWSVSLRTERDKAAAAEVAAAEARDRAQGLVSVLLGEGFLGRVRDAGFNELLGQVGEQTLQALGQGAGRSLNRGLALRNEGESLRQRGKSSSALVKLQQALDNFEPGGADGSAAAGPVASALVASGVSASPPSAASLPARREAARTHSQIGAIYADQGKVDQALAQQAAAERLWAAVDSSGAAQVSDCTAWAESLLRLAWLQQQQGQDQQARAAMVRALARVQQVLFGVDPVAPACHPARPAAGPEPRLTAMPDPLALDLLGQAALLRGMLDSSSDDMHGAVQLARRVRWLQPGSTTARRDELTARLVQAAYSTGADHASTWATYQRVLNAMDDLLRLEPGNQHWRRDHAQAQVLMSRHLTGCLAQRPPVCGADASRGRATELALSALATQRALVAVDPDNVAWRLDLAWGYSTYGEALAGSADTALDERGLAAFDDAHQVLEPLARTGNHEARVLQGELLVRRAAVVERLGNPVRPMKDIEAALAIYSTLAEPAVSQVPVLVRLRDAHEALDATASKAGEPERAAKARAQAQAIELKLAQLQQRANAEQSEWVALDGPSALAQLAKQQSLDQPALVRRAHEGVNHWRRYLAARPADTQAYLMLNAWYEQLAKALDLDGAAANDSPLKQARVPALVSAMRAADAANILAQQPHNGELRARLPQTQERLFEARRKLVNLLLDDGRTDEALKVLEVMVRDAQSAVTVQDRAVAGPGLGSEPTSPKALALALWQLWDAEFALGATLLGNYPRDAGPPPGWEEMLRHCLLQMDRLMQLPPPDLPTALLSASQETGLRQPGAGTLAARTVQLTLLHKRAMVQWQLANGLQLEARLSAQGAARRLDDAAAGDLRRQKAARANQARRAALEDLQALRRGVIGLPPNLAPGEPPRTPEQIDDSMAELRKLLTD
ncbi:MAG: hypothetical protein CFE45_01700, partial [Burkholderiales bacterium PBB5]